MYIAGIYHGSLCAIGVSPAAWDNEMYVVLLLMLMCELKAQRIAKDGLSKGLRLHKEVLNIRGRLFVPNIGALPYGGILYMVSLYRGTPM